MEARAAAGLVGRSCLCARHLRRRHLGGGLRGACGKAWRLAPRNAGSGSAHCGGAELGPEAGSGLAAVSDARGGQGPGLRTRGPPPRALGCCEESHLALQLPAALESH